MIGAGKLFYWSKTNDVGHLGKATLFTSFQCCMS